MSTKIVIEAIVFDCFGVLAADGWLPFKHKYFDHDPALFEKVSNLNIQSNMGRLSYDEFIVMVTTLAGVSEAELRNAVRNNTPNEELLGYIATQLKPKYKIGMLSNASSNWLSSIFTKEQIALLDSMVLSYDVNVVKPDPRAYQTIVARLGVKPGNCVFIDDQERYCIGARAVGMQAIAYESFEQMKRDLEQVLAQ